MLARVCDFLDAELAVDPPPRRGTSWYDLVTVSYGFVDASPHLLAEVDPHFHLTPATPRVRRGTVTMIVTGSLSDWVTVIRETDDSPDPDVRETIAALRTDLTEVYPTAMADLLAEAEDVTSKGGNHG